MNKRIKELALEADLITHKVPNGLAHLHTEKDLEKFAELIVKECADVCRDDGRWFQEQDDKVEAGVAYALCYKIKENFGIEE